MDRTRSQLLVAVASLAFASSVDAQDAAPAASEAGRVYVVSVPMEPGLDAIATRAGSAARAALRNVEGVDWRGPDQLFLGYDDSALQRLAQARTQLEEGRQAYLNLELDRAIELLQGAVASFDVAAAALEDPTDLGNALLFLGASQSANGQRREAIAAFRRLQTQMPHIRPDPDTFNPEIVQLFESSRPSDASSGQIAITSDPPGAIAYVDFLARGRTPITVDSLAPGDHLVRVTRPGATPFVEPQTLRAGRRATSSAYLADTPNLEGLSDALERIAQADVAAIREGSPIGEVATMLDLDKVGVIRVSPAGDGQVQLEILLFDVASGRRLLRGQGTVPTAIGQLEDGVNRLVAGAFAAALRPARTSATPVETPEDPTPVVTIPTVERPVTDEWWFWTAIGGGGALLIGAIIGIAVAAQGPSLGNEPGGQVVFTF